MRRATAIAACIAICVAAGCSGRYADTAPEYIDDEEKEDYAVYSAGIEYVYTRNLLADNKKELKTIVIIAQTNELDEFWRSRFAGRLAGKDVPEELIEDWRTNNGSSMTLERKFGLSYDYILVTRTQLDTYKPETFFSEFYRKYPDSNGLISVSRTGFDRSRSSSLLHVIHNYGSLGADYYFLLMEKTDKGWTVAKRISTGGS